MFIAPKVAAVRLLDGQGSHLLPQKQCCAPRCETGKLTHQYVRCFIEVNICLDGSNDNSLKICDFGFSR